VVGFGRLVRNCTAGFDEQVVGPHFANTPSPMSKVEPTFCRAAGVVLSRLATAGTKGRSAILAVDGALKQLVSNATGWVEVFASVLAALQA